MPFAFLIIGAVAVVAGVRGQGKNLASLLKGDFTGQNSYIYWLISILIIGAIGYIDALKDLSRAFMALVIVVLLLREGNPNGQGGGFFEEFNKAIGTSQTASSTVSIATSGLATAVGPTGTAYTDTSVGSALQDLGTYGTGGATTSTIQTTNPDITTTL